MARPWRDIGRYGSVGIELLLTILIASAIGHWIDGRYGSRRDWGMGIGFVVGVAVAFRNLVRTAQGMQKDIERTEAQDPQAGRWTVDEGWLYKPDESGKAVAEPDANPGRPREGGGPDRTP